MSEEQQTTPEGTQATGSQPESTQHSVEGSWQEVGRQFQTLGESLAQTVRTAWGNDETQRRVQEMRSGLESMVKEVGQAIDDSLKTPQGQKIRDGAVRTAESVKAASEQTVQEARPQIIHALEQLNNELQKLINRMEQPRSQPVESTTQEKDTSGDPEI